MTNPETPSAAPVAWCRSGEFAQFAQGREYLLAFSEQHPDCEMALYAQPQAGAAQDADQAEGPSVADVDELCAEFGFHLDDDQGDGLEILRDMITATITRWRAPVAKPVATPAPQEPDADRVLKLAAIIREVDLRPDTNTLVLGENELAEAILAHPGFSGCHDGPAALPAPDHLNLIGFAFGREPWATWLRQGGCLESAHCELSDLMLAVLARWGRPAALHDPNFKPNFLRYEFSVHDENDQEVASGDADTFAEVAAQGCHYFAQSMDDRLRVEFRCVQTMDCSKAIS